MNNSYRPVQENRLSSGDYDRNGFIKYIQDMPYEDFNRFCREIMFLNEYYDTSQGASVCDMLDFIEEHKEKFWELTPIDPDKPVNFEIIN